MERFINACNYRKIKIWDLSASDGSYEMNLWVKDFKKLRHISRKTSTKITIVKKYGLPFYLFDHRRRKLFFAGILAATVLLLIMSGYIWDIEILGTHTQTEEVIRTFLKENHPAYRKRIDTGNLGIEISAHNNRNHANPTQ